MSAIITAHSGSDGTPDNSLEFVRYALSCPVEALEVDVRVRPDGSFFLSHDASDDVCPDLREVFSLLRGSGKLVNCDLKNPGMELGVLALAKKSGIAEQLLFSGDVSPALVWENAQVRERTLFNLDPFAADTLRRFRSGQEPTREDLESIARQCTAFGVGTINIPYGLCTQTFLRFFRERNIAISAWTVNDAETAEWLLRADIRNITTRSPKKLTDLRRKLFAEQ